VVGHLIGLWNALGSTQTTVVCAADDLAMAASWTALECGEPPDRQPPTGTGNVRVGALCGGLEWLAGGVEPLGGGVGRSTARARENVACAGRLLPPASGEHLSTQPRRTRTATRCLAGALLQATDRLQETTLKEFLAARTTAGATVRESMTRDGYGLGSALRLPPRRCGRALVPAPAPDL